MEPSTEEMITEFSGPETDAVTETAQPEAQAESQPTVQEYEYTANGKTIREPLETILKRASQGYNYAQHMNDFKQRQQEVEQKEAYARDLEAKYGEIDKFAKENPEWNEHLNNTWQSRFDITGGQNPQPQQGIPEQFQQEFNEMKSFVENMKAQQADQAYNQTLEQVKQSYPDVDFSATDPDTGMSLEQQVLEYADKNSIGRFEPAFKAFYSDKLVEQARTQAKNQLAGDLQKRSKAGILGTANSPAQSGAQDMDMPPNYKNMSHDQLHNWIVSKYAN